MSTSDPECLLACLGAAQLFQGLSQDELWALAQIAQLQIYAKGESLFHQGDAGIGFFVIQTGRIKVFQLSATGREQILHIFAEGDHFAEVPALDGQPFPASAAALDPTQVLLFPRQAFLDLLYHNPTLSINLLKSFARHLRRFSRLVDNLSLREVPGRLAAYLLALSEQAHNSHQIELDINKGHLAALLGTIPETLSRVFYKLTQDGVIDVEGSTIRLLDLTRLQQLAE